MAVPVTPHHGHSAASAEAAARGSFWLAIMALVAVGLAVAIIGIGYAVGGADAVEDTWVGMLGVIAVFAALAASLLAFLTASTVAVLRRHATDLWLALLTFPALAALIVLGELFVWE